MPAWRATDRTSDRLPLPRAPCRRTVRGRAYDAARGVKEDRTKAERRFAGVGVSRSIGDGGDRDSAEASSAHALCQTPI